MDEIEDLAGGALASPVGAPPSRGDLEVRVRRRSRRRMATALISVALLVGSGVALALSRGEDPGAGTVAAADDGDSGPGSIDDGTGDDSMDGPSPPGTVPVSSTDTVPAEAADIPYPECSGLPEPGPPSGDDRAELQALRDRLESEGLFSQEYVVGVGGPGDVWGLITVGLSRRHQPTIDWLVARAPADELCLELPPVGYYLRPPTLADWTLSPDSEPVEDDWRSLTLLVTVGECGLIDPTRILPAEVNYTGTAIEVAVPLRVPDWGPTSLPCLAPDRVMLELAEPPRGRPLVPVEALSTIGFDPPVAAPGATVRFAFDPTVVVSAVMGDDVIMTLVDDADVRVQFSGVFTAEPVASLDAVGVDDDGWAVSGTGSIVLPAATESGTYYVEFIDHPQLNGLLTVATGGPPSTGPVAIGDITITRIASRGGPEGAQETVGRCYLFESESAESAEACLYAPGVHSWRWNGADYLLATGPLALADGTVIEFDEGLRLAFAPYGIDDPGPEFPSCLTRELASAVVAELGPDDVPPFLVSPCSPRYSFVGPQNESPSQRDIVIVFEQREGAWTRLGDVDFGDRDRNSRCSGLPDSTGPSGETSARGLCLLAG